MEPPLKSGMLRRDSKMVKQTAQMNNGGIKMIEAFAREARRLLSIEGAWWPDESLERRCAGAVLYFENAAPLVLSVAMDTDEIILGLEKNANLQYSEISKVYPSLQCVHGQLLRWCWIMKNHQGYQDALQLEFSDMNMERPVTIQFSVAGSKIRIFELTEPVPNSEGK